MERKLTDTKVKKAKAKKEHNKIRAAYNRAQYLEERTRMMQAWSDYLDKLKAGGQVIPFKTKAGFEQFD